MPHESPIAPSVVAWLLSAAVKQKTLVKLAGRLGLEFPGSRLMTIPSNVIADALVERWNEPDVRREIIEVLNRSVPDERARVAQADSREEALRDLISTVLRRNEPRRLEGLIWALARSPDEEARGLAEGLIHSIEHVALKQEVSSAYAEIEDLESTRVVVATDLQGTRQALRRAERDRDRLAEQNGRLRRQLADAATRLRALGNEQKALEKELAMLRRLREDAQAAVATRLALEADLARLRQDLAAGKDVEATWRIRADEMEAERRGLLADLEEMSRWLHRQPGRREGSEARVAVYMDGENLLYGARTAFGDRAKVSLSRVLAAAARGRTVAQAVAYVGRLPVEGIWEPPQPTLAHYQPPYRIRHREPTKRDSATWTGNWDVGIAVDILTQSGGVDVIALASGDGDFLPLLVYCKRHGVRTEVLAFPGSASTPLTIAADLYQDLGPEVLWAGDQVPGSISAH